MYATHPAPPSHFAPNTAYNNPLNFSPAIPKQSPNSTNSSSSATIPNMTNPQASLITSVNPLQSNPNLLHIPRQMHAPRSPLYRPAVLRPTDYPTTQPLPQTQQQITPPPSTHASLESLHEAGYSSSEGAATSASPRATSWWGLLLGSGAYYPTGLGGQLSDEILESVVEEEDSESPVTMAGGSPPSMASRQTSRGYDDESASIKSGIEGRQMQPTRKHWKPDSSSSRCAYPHCHTVFSLTARRHHCRRCGNIFCATHSAHLLRLDPGARFHPAGIPSRCCDQCFADLRRLREDKKKRLQQPQPHSPVIETRRPKLGDIAGGDSRGGIAGKVGSYVGSVPRDWSWSTF